MSELYRETELMSPFERTLRFFLIFMFAVSMAIGGCSYIPWIDDDDDNLAFEEDFPFEDEDRSASNTSEDDFFEDGERMEDEDRSASNTSEDDFASIDQRTDKNELQGDVGTLQTQQEALISKVRELEETLASLGPRINATQEQLEGSLSAVSGSADFLEPEVEELKLQVARLNDEINRLKTIKSSNKRARGISRRRASTPPQYNQALSSYRTGNYDESILQFQSYALASPPERLKDNIAYWLGSNYVQLEMYDDAVSQFEQVINAYPRGNKVHDAKFMLGRIYSLKGESSKAIEIFQSALRNNPPAEVRGKISRKLKELQ
jgi:TolA-binding protein